MPEVDALPSWNNGTVKHALLAFVAKIGDPTSPDFVPPSARVAAFDNDGTLWGEQPTYTQAYFVFERVNVLAEPPTRV